MRPAGVSFIFSGLIFYAPGTVGAGRDLADDLTPDAAGIIRPDEFPPVALPLPAGEDFGPERVRDPTRLDGYLVCGCVRGHGTTTDFASVHPFSRGWRFQWAGGLMSGRARDGFSG